MAMGSSCEVEYQLMLARDLGYLESSLHKKVEGMVIEIKKMLAALIGRVQG
jgi:four helix bundle protein